MSDPLILHSAFNPLFFCSIYLLNCCQIVVLSVIFILSYSIRGLSDTSRYLLIFSKFFKCGIRFPTGYPKFKCKCIPSYFFFFTIINVPFALGTALSLILTLLCFYPLLGILLDSRRLYWFTEQFLKSEFELTVLEKAEEPEIKLLTSTRTSKKQESSRKTSISALLTMPKPLTVWITINCGKFWKRWEYQATWPASWETYMQVRK